MDVNRDALNQLHAMTSERFKVKYQSHLGTVREHGPDSASGIIAYLMPSDKIIELVKV